MCIKLRPILWRRSGSSKGDGTTRIRILKMRQNYADLDPQKETELHGSGSWKWNGTTWIPILKMWRNYGDPDPQHETELRIFGSAKWNGTMRIRILKIRRMDPDPQNKTDLSGSLADTDLEYVVLGVQFPLSISRLIWWNFNDELGTKVTCLCLFSIKFWSRIRYLLTIIQVLSHLSPHIFLTLQHVSNPRS